MAYTLPQVTDYLTGLSTKYGATMEPDDPQKLLDKLTGQSSYMVEGGGDPNLAFQEFDDQYKRRGSSGATGTGVDSSYLSSIGVGQGQPQSAGLQQYLQQLSALQQTNNSDPTVDPASWQPQDLPSIDVGGANLSPAIDSRLLSLLGGEDPLDLEGMLSGLLGRTAGGGVNSDRLQGRLEAARENLTRGEEGALADMRGVLADRGLISLPGSPSGAETDATQRVLLPLQREYLQNIRGIESDESMRADDEELNALQVATGWDRNRASQELSAATAAGGRQQMLSDIAFRNLEDNMQWNQFLANFGLSREKLQADIEQGRFDSVIPLLQIFLGMANAASNGYY